MPRFSLLSTLVLLGAILSLSCSAYVPQQQQQQSTRPVFSLEVASKHAPKPFSLPAAVATASAFVVASAPSVAQAVAAADEEYEYGAVDAPIGLAVGGGILAILTALLPIALRGGEEAFEEIKEREKGTFGKSNKDVLKGGKK